MELHKIIVLSVGLLVLFLLILFAIVYTRKSRKAIRNSQTDVTDKELIEFINSQPDKIVNSQTLIEAFGLTKFEAGGRLRHFYYNGLLRMLRTGNGMKSYYTLSKSIEKSYDLDLTEAPFMTVEDLLMIFKHYDFQVSLQEICLSTGLPIKVILEEMRYFQKEKVVNCLFSSNGYGLPQRKIYLLREPYRSNPDGFLNLKNANFELKEIYEKIRKA